jgi:hypothetical protein
MNNKFGALTDHFNIENSSLILINSSEQSDAMSRSDASDECGDTIAATWYGNTSKALKTVSCTYKLKSGTLNLDTLKLGELEPSIIAESIDVATSNSDHPTITINGKLGTETITAPTGKKNTYTLPSIEIKGIKCAQPMGAVFTNGNVNDSNLSASVELFQMEDGAGEPVAHGLSGGILIYTASIVMTTDAITWTVPTGFQETQAPGSEQGQAAWHTTSVGAEKILTRDSSGT